LELWSVVAITALGALTYAFYRVCAALGADA
jgi:hypothetical protein